MALSIIVCVKPVPSSQSATIDPNTKMVRRDIGENVINPLDKNALQAAAELKKQYDCDITVLAMAPPSAESALREALARGGDRVIVLSDRTFAGGDTYSTSYVLANAINRIGKFDLILTGAYSADGGTSQVPVQLAEWLGIPYITNATEIEVTEDGIRAVTEADGRILSWKGTLPMVISVNRKINHPRAAGIREILAARRKEYRILTAEQLDGLDGSKLGLQGSPTQFGDMYEISGDRNCEMMKGKPEELAERILEILRERGAYL